MDEFSTTDSLLLSFQKLFELRKEWEDEDVKKGLRE